MTTTSALRRARVARIEAPCVRVVSYCRRSVEKVAVEFGSVEAQREAIASYVASQKERGWTLLPEGYEDRNVSGATTERPGLRRLLADAQAGRFDVLCLYKLDRLSRRLVDFLDLLRKLETCDVSVVSVTQAIDTSTPAGRLMLNVMASFAEYEREQISERIADKMGAARRRGQWQGGRPVLGYDVVDKRLVANPDEAQDVVAIFETYARTTSWTSGSLPTRTRRTTSLVATLRELERRGIRLKSWTTKRGKRNEGAAFRDHSLRTLLGNPLYVGRMPAGAEVVDGEHDGIVPRELWDEVQALLAGGRRERASTGRQPWSGLLTGVLRCAVCGSGMVPSHCSKKGRRYGYYVCQQIKTRGAGACPGSRVAQGAVEAAVVERIMAVGRDPALVAEAVRAAHAEVAAKRAELQRDAQRAGTEAARLSTEIDNLVARGAGVPELRRRLDGLREAHEAATRRATAAKDEITTLRAPRDEGELRRAIESVAPCWDALFPAERARLIRLLIERVTVDARTGDVAIAFHAGGIGEMAQIDGAPRPT